MGVTMATSMPIIDITASISTSVNARLRRIEPMAQHILLDRWTLSMAMCNQSPPPALEKCAIFATSGGVDF
jgi:hypothetical protein